MLIVGASNGSNRVARSFRLTNNGGSRKPGTLTVWSLIGDARPQKRFMRSGQNWDSLRHSGTWTPDNGEYYTCLKFLITLDVT